MPHAAPPPGARSRATSRPGSGGRLTTLLLALGLAAALPAAPSTPASSAPHPTGDRLSVAGPGLAPALPPSAVPGTAHDLDGRRRDGRGPGDGDGPGRVASATQRGEVAPARSPGPPAAAQGGRVRDLPAGFVPDRSLAPPFPA